MWKGFFIRAESEEVSINLDEIIEKAKEEEPEPAYNIVAYIVITEVNKIEDYTKILEEVQNGNVVIVNASKLTPKDFTELIKILKSKAPGDIAQIGNTHRILVTPQTIRILRK